MYELNTPSFAKLYLGGCKIHEKFMCSKLKFPWALQLEKMPRAHMWLWPERKDGPLLFL
jgi:hypothetical protein